MYEEFCDSKMSITDYSTNHKTVQVERNHSAWTTVDNVKFFAFLAEIHTFSEESGVWMHDPVHGKIVISGEIGITSGTVYSYERFFIAFKDELQDLLKRYCESDESLTWTKEMLYN